MKQQDDHTYTLRLIVRNRPGILVRCAQVLGRRSHNIERLHVEPQADHPDRSSMTITAYGRQESVPQIVAQLSKLIDVMSVNKEEA
jgi:acetolactate synthase-1/3 small subunit